MDTTFPFGLPGATALYAALYVATLALHWFCMQTMLGGSLYLAVRALRGQQSVADPLAEQIRSWMPFTVSVAITAGIAPLLFQQILYRKAFYTANLLLPYRYMLIAPLLIGVLYLLYVMKSRWIGTRPRSARMAPVMVLGALLVVAATWIEGHRLALQDVEVWRDVYLRQPMFFADGQVAPRLLWWLGLSVPISAWIWVRLTLQEDAPGTRDAVRRVAVYSLLGLGVALVAALWHASDAGAQAAWQRTTSLWQPYALLVVAGLVALVWTWLRVLRGHPPRTGPSLVVAFLLLLGVAVVREALRLHALDLDVLAEQHAAASEKGGVVAMLVFAPLGILVIAWLVRAVRRDLEADAAA
jgi:hypothetical protein